MYIYIYIYIYIYYFSPLLVGFRSDEPESECDLHKEKDAFVECKSCQVAAGRGTHATLDPDDERENVAWNAEDVPDRRDVQVYGVYGHPRR